MSVRVPLLPEAVVRCRSREWPECPTSCQHDQLLHGLLSAQRGTSEMARGGRVRPGSCGAAPKLGPFTKLRAQRTASGIILPSASVGRFCKSRQPPRVVSPLSASAAQRHAPKC